jgi:hypothetical protein
MHRTQSRSYDHPSPPFYERFTLTVVLAKRCGPFAAARGYITKHHVANACGFEDLCIKLLEIHADSENLDCLDLSCFEAYFLGTRL